MKKALVNVILLIVSILLLGTFGVIGVLYGIIKNAFGFGGKAINLAIIIDILGNYICAELFNDVLITKNSSYKFGIEFRTVSYVLRKNRDKYTLTKAGKALVVFIEFFDPNHLDKVVI